MDKTYRNIYYNANYQACCAVAVINNENGKIFDWAAYINGVPYDMRERDAIEWVAENGCKLPEKIARSIWNIDGEYRR